MTERAFLLILATGCIFLGKTWYYMGLFFESPLILIGIPSGILLLFLVLRRNFFQKSLFFSLLLGIALLVETVYHFVEGGFQLPNLIEHSLLWATPILILLPAPGFPKFKTLSFVAISLTFTGHGVYAIGWPYPVPPHFLSMVMEILGFSLPESISFLRFMGGIDLIAVILLWNPKSERYALMYMVFWGLTTAIARPWAFVQITTLQEDLMIWLPHMIYRLPHGLVPLYFLGKDITKPTKS